MASRELRLWGDPFLADGPSCALRQLAVRASAAGWRCGLSLSAARGEGDGGGRALPLTDGVRDIVVHTRLAADEVDAVLSWSSRPVAATAPLVVFGEPDDEVQAGLEHPLASMVLFAHGLDIEEVLARLHGHDQGWPRTDPAWSLPDELLGEFAGLPLASGAGRVLHVGSPHPASGTDVAVRAAAETGLPLTVLLPEADEVFERAVLTLAHDIAPNADVEFAAGALTPERLESVSAVLLPVRTSPEPEVLLPALVSGRPVIVSRFAATAEVLSAPGICSPIGGVTNGGVFEPDAAALRVALEELVAHPERVRSRAERARCHVLTHHRRQLPAPPVPAVAGSRPVVVLEAPLLEVSSASVLTIETARALMARDNVDVWLVPVPPLQSHVATWRHTAPDLLPRLCRRPPRADLWLSAGWPPRPSRPEATTFALRVDWEYGALPVELTPAVTQEADVVVVHSHAVERIVSDAGRRGPIARIPHGVDGAVFHSDVAPSSRVLEFKGDRTALLFVGGTIWRKGVDLLLSAWLGDEELREEAVLVIKSLGANHSYAGYHLGGLIDKVRRLGRDVLLIDDELSAREMAGIYRACDVLVHPYRGEGFGMPALEARACGVPVVVTCGGSTDDFCTGPGTVGIEAARRTVELPGAHVGRPWVLEPDAGDVRAAIRSALANLPDLQRAARDESAAVRAHYTWTAAAAALEDLAMASHAGCVPAPREPVGVGPVPSSGGTPID